MRTITGRVRSAWRHLTRGLHVLAYRAAADAETDTEIRDYLERAAAAHAARGLSPEEARRAAQLEIGNMTVTREQVHASGWEHALETTLADVRYALRRLRGAPVFTATAVVTLALGIGASTAVFSAVSPILLEPLPFPNADRIVSVDDRNQQGIPMPATLGTYEELRARSRSFDVLAAADQWRTTIAGDGDPDWLIGQRVTANYFRVFGASPFVGRGFTDAEDQPGGPHVVILSEGFVSRRFGGDRAIVGRTIRLNGDPYVVVGVMPRSFENVIVPNAEVWTPMQERATGDFGARAWGHHYQIVGRLSPPRRTAAATSELQAIAGAPIASFARPPWANLRKGLLVRPLQDVLSGQVKPSLFAIIGAVILLLAIAAVNVTNLLLARGAQRRAEFAMRIALGAGGGRLVRQLLTESIVLALCGGVLALGVARYGVRALVAASPATLPRVDAIRVDAHVFLFALVLTTFVGVVVGLVPALGALRADVTSGLQRGTRRTTGAHTRGRSVLVIAEVAIAITLLVTAGLLFRSMQHLFANDPGFDASHVVTMQVVEAGPAFQSDTTRLAFFQQALDAVQHVPGVTSAAFASNVPMRGSDGYGYELQSVPNLTKGAAGDAQRFAVMPGYFAAMHIPLRQGRLLDARDRPGAPEAVVISESMARQWFKNSNPIGQRIRFGPEMGGDHWDYIVGVVGDVKVFGLAADAPDAFYVADGQWSGVDNVQTLVVRASGDPTALVPSIKRAIWGVNANPPIQHVASMQSLVDASAGQRRFAMLAIEVFAAAALVLAAIGLYGVISGSVTERLREIGIRAALGASPHDVVRVVMRRGLALTLAGSSVGLVGAWVASRLLVSMLYHVSRVDPFTDAAVVALLLAIALLASWAPAVRAGRVDPAAIMRAE